MKFKNITASAANEYKNPVPTKDDTSLNFCIRCKKPISIPLYAYNNAEYNKKTVVIVSECCGQAYRVKAVTLFKIFEYRGNKTEDDWANPIKKEKQIKDGKGKK